MTSSAHTSEFTFPRVVLPQREHVFFARATRLQQLATDNSIAEYLQFLSHLSRAQHTALGTIHTTLPSAEACQRARQHGMPLIPVSQHIDPVWQSVLQQLLHHLSQQPHGSHSPQALLAVMQKLRMQSAGTLEQWAQRALDNTLPEEHLDVSPLLMAALQVVFVDQASRLRVQDLPLLDTATLCPICASQPVASLLQIEGSRGDNTAGLRYLQCGLCATQWHMVRVKCSHCESTQGIQYQGVEGTGETVLAETCDQCHTYRKIMNRQKDPMADTMADDIATLTLDLLMAQTPYRRASTNPLLALAAD